MLTAGGGAQQTDLVRDRLIARDRPVSCFQGVKLQQSIESGFVQREKEQLFLKS